MRLPQLLPYLSLLIVVDKAVTDLPLKSQPETQPESQIEIDRYWMQQAFLLAKQAEKIGEIPVGAVVVHNNQIVGKGYNQSILLNDPSAHAEMLAIRDAGKTLKNYRLIDCDLYVTLEPCAMCSGLLVHSRLRRLVYAAKDAKTGCAGSVMDLVRHDSMNHVIEVVQGVMEQECSENLSAFFRKRRAEIKARKQLKKNQQN